MCVCERERERERERDPRVCVLMFVCVHEICKFCMNVFLTNSCECVCVCVCDVSE